MSKYKKILLGLTTLLSLSSISVLPTVTNAEELSEPLFLSTDIYPEVVTYNDNAVISITLDEELIVSEIFLDLTEIGGNAATRMDNQLMEHTIAIHENTTAGVKTIPILLMDNQGMTHRTEIELEVKPREMKTKHDFDWDEAVIYFLLTDRFKDGDPTNNDPNDENYDVSHSETYHGGDLQGIINQLDYLEALGINTIWMTPIVDNVNHNHRHGKDGAQYGYHGYWAKDFTKIDEHLGDLDTFKNLIDQAHDRGIKIMVDVVLNHTGYGMKRSDQAANIPNFPTSSEQAVFDGMLRDEPLSGHDILGEIYGLPDFISEEEAVRNQIIAWQTDWIERARTDRGDTIDYFRVDTIKHMEDTTWNAFKNELTKVKPNFKLIGESWGATYNNTGGYLNSGQMDSLLDFDFKRIASMFAHGSIEQAETELMKRNEALTNSATVGHFLSSHDEDGFLYYFMQGDENLFKVAVSLQLTAKGQPVIYYGEEIGVSGKAEGNMDAGEFSENREDFDWDAIENNHLVEHYKKILASRKNHSKTFAKGDRQHLKGTNEEGYSIFSRSFEDETVYIALNTTNEEKEVHFEVPYERGDLFRDEYSDKLYSVSTKNELRVTLPATMNGGTVILTADDQVEQTSPGNEKMGLILIIGISAVGIGTWLYRKVR